MDNVTSIHKNKNLGECNLDYFNHKAVTQELLGVINKIKVAQDERESKENNRVD